MASTIAVSVVIPAYRAGPTLGRCVAAVLDQGLDVPFEVVVVRSGLGEPDGTAEHGGPLPVDPRLRVVDHAERLTAAQARNRGARSTDPDGAALAFTDADAVPGRRWLAELLAASADGSRAVAGAIVNGTPASAAGTAEYLVAFLDLHPDRPIRTAWHGATCNLLVPRAIWDERGPFPEDMTGGEDTVLTAALHRDHLLRFAPHATVTHLNRTRARSVIAHQYDYGRFSGLVAARGPYKLGVVVRVRALAPVAGALRVVSLLGRAVRWGGVPWRVGVRATPIAVAAIGAWTLGLLTGPRRTRPDGQLNSGHRRSAPP